MLAWNDLSCALTLAVAQVLTVITQILYPTQMLYPNALAAIALARQHHGPTNSQARLPLHIAGLPSEGYPLNTQSINKLLCV